MVNARRRPPPPPTAIRLSRGSPATGQAGSNDDGDLLLVTRREVFCKNKSGKIFEKITDFSLK
jgi:hypothetical protein